jgi:hypothetical protein
VEDHKKVTIALRRQARYRASAQGVPRCLRREWPASLLACECRSFCEPSWAERVTKTVLHLSVTSGGLENGNPLFYRL